MGLYEAIPLLFEGVEVDIRMSEMLQEKIRWSLINGRLPCEVAFKIAEEFKVDPRKVREAADELKVKISSCRLGCFP